MMNPFWVKKKEYWFYKDFVHPCILKKNPAKSGIKTYYFLAGGAFNFELISNEIAERSILSFPAIVSMTQV